MTTVSSQRLAVTSETGANPMFRSIVIWLLLLTVLLFPISPAQAQQTKKVPRIGILFGGSSSGYMVRVEAFRQGLKELGYIEGKNIAIEYRYADGKADRLLSLATELVFLKVDVIVAPSIPSVLATQKATSTIPIVFVSVSDPVASGLVASLARPGGNVTGLANFAPELSGKRVELLNAA